MLINNTAGRRSCESMDGFIVHAESELTEVGRRVIKLLSKASMGCTSQTIVCPGWLSSLYVSKYCVTCWRDFSISDRSEFRNLGQMYENKCLRVFNFLQAKLLFSCTVVVLFSKKCCQIRYSYLFVWNNEVPRFNSNARTLAISRIWLFCLFYDNWLHVKTVFTKNIKNLSSSEVTFILDPDHKHSVPKISVFLGACSHTSISSDQNGQVNQPWDMAGVVEKNLLQTYIPWIFKGLFIFLFLLKWSNIRNKTIMTTLLYYFLLLILVQIVLCSLTKTLNWSRKTFLQPQ